MSAYRPDIDGLRAVAVLSVVLYHLDPHWVPGGFVGVDVFFVISGFLITRLVVEEVDAGSFTFVHFYIRRIRRIFPALLVMLCLVVAAALLILTPMEMDEFGRTLRYASAQASNILFQRQVPYFSDGFDNSPLLHTWSLAVEEQFYLIWPPLILGLYKLSGKRWRVVALVMALIVAASLGTSEYLVGASPQLAFYSLPSRLWEIGLGGMLSVQALDVKGRAVKELTGIVGLAAVGFSVLAVSSESFPGLGAAIPCAGVALLIVAGSDSRILVSRLLRFRYLVFIGLISYSLYLWHWPIIALFKRFMAEPELGPTAGAAIFMVSMILATLSWKYVERPFRRTRKLSWEGYAIVSLPGRPGEARVYHAVFAGMSGVVMLVSAAVWLQRDGEGISRAITGLREDPGMIYAPPEVIDCEEKGDRPRYLESEQEMRRRCRFEPRAESGHPAAVGGEALVIGDSHAGHYAKGLLEWFSARGVPARLLWESGCVPLFDFPQGDDAREKELCARYIHAVRQLLGEERRIKYVVLAARWDAHVDAEGFRESLKSTIRVLAASGRQVVVMGQIPKFPFHPANNFVRGDVLLSRMLGVGLRPQDLALSDVESDLGRQRAVIKGLIAGSDGAQYFDPLKYLCRNGECDSVRDGKMLYYDQDHLNINGTEYVGRFLDDTFSRLVAGPAGNMASVLVTELGE